MNASLQKKGNIYYAVVSLPDGAGKYKTKWISTKCVKKTEAGKVMRGILDKLESGQSVSQSRHDFMEFMRYWLDEVIRPQIEQTTYEGYMQNLERHIKPYFAPLNLSVEELQLTHLQKFVNDKHKNGRLDGEGGLTGKSIKKYMANVGKALDYAVKTGIIRQNPARYVDFPKDKAFTGAFYSVEEIDKLLKACKGTPIETPIILATHYGLRRGEIMGLRWQDVNFATGTLTIQNTRVRIKSVVEKPPKSASSLRTFPLIASVGAHLQTLKVTQEEHKELFGKLYTDSDYICRWPDGRPQEVGYLNGAMSKLLRENGLRHIRVHDLRHSTASYLNKLGFSPKEIQVWLGHSDIKTTMNIYTHIDVGMKENIATKIDGLFSDF